MLGNDICCYAQQGAHQALLLRRQRCMACIASSLQQDSLHSGNSGTSAPLSLSVCCLESGLLDLPSTALVPHADLPERGESVEAAPAVGIKSRWLLDDEEDLTAVNGQASIYI